MSKLPNVCTTYALYMKSTSPPSSDDDHSTFYLHEGGAVFAQGDPKPLVHPRVPVQKLVFVPEHDRRPHNGRVRQNRLHGLFTRVPVRM
jgi:hypothetical protein